MALYLKLLDQSSLQLIDNSNKIILVKKAIYTKFEQFKRIKKDCNIIKENDFKFPTENRECTNIYCLDDKLNIKWFVKPPERGDVFCNSIIWNKSYLNDINEYGDKISKIKHNSDTFICSSWAGYTLTVDYENGQAIERIFTK